jgi:2-dehydro-3-deoxygluconokinase
VDDAASGDSAAPPIVVAGEGMIELARDAAGWRVHYGGDTLNMAVHLARFGLHPAFLTALGSDPFSKDLRTSAWVQEGIDTSLVLVDPERAAGLYAITTDAAGDRSFTYWRRDSAATALFAHPQIDAALARVIGTRLFVFSLISLAVLDDSGRAALLGVAEQVRAAGGRVAYDGNYRARLWRDREEAQAWHARAIALADIGLPTIDDEIALTGEADPEAVAARWRALGCPEVVVKLGADGCLLPDGTRLAPPERLVPADTSGAGDAFCAGYLAGRRQGLAPAEAALRGHRLAAWVVMRRGAIPPLDDDAPYARI